MKTPTIKSVVATMLVTLSAIALAQGATSHPRWSLVDLLVWDADLSIDIAAYPADVRAQIDALRKRSKAYKSSRPKTDDGLNGMGYGARVRYERRLVAAAGAETDALALAYVNDLRPYYEWEGGSEGPRMEAEFAAQYQAAHPAGPFSHYLPLLEAHRWLCAAEGFDYEKSSADAAKSRAAYSKALSVAQQSKSLLVRTAATELGKRNKCHVE